RVAHAQIVLVGELVPREDHRHANRREKAREGQLDSLLRPGDAVVQKKVEQSLVSESLDVVAAPVVPRLRAIGEPHQPAVDQFSDRPLEAWLTVVISAEDDVADASLEAFVPEA